MFNTFQHGSLCSDVKTIKKISVKLFCKFLGFPTETENLKYQKPNKIFEVKKINSPNKFHIFFNL